MNQELGTSSVFTLVRKRQLAQCGSFHFRRQVSKLLQGSKELLVDPEIVSPHQSAISSLAVDPVLSRFVLTGSADATVSIFDLSHWGSEGFIRKLTHPSSFQRFRPVAQSTKVPTIFTTDDESSLLRIPRGHSAAITQVQWYPVDSGAFMSCATDGCILLWDTNRVEPVLKVTPFAESLENTDASATWGSAHWQPNGDHTLIAAGSWYDSCLRLVDVRSGACSHQLMGHSRGVTTVKWSDTNPVILASGSCDGTIRLWDIRKSGSNACVTVFGRDWSAFQDIPHPPYRGDYSHLRMYADAVRKRKKQSRKRKLGLNDKGHVIEVAPNNFNHVQRHGIRSHESHVASIAFLPGCQQLASIGGEGDLLLWDLRHGPELMERKFLSPGRRPAATPRQRRSAMCVDADEGIIWVGYNCSLMGYSIEGGAPKHILRGHLQNITSIDTLHPESTLLSGSSDGMVLSWGKPKRSVLLPQKSFVKEDQDKW